MSRTWGTDLARRLHGLSRVRRSVSARGRGRTRRRGGREPARYAGRPRRRAACAGGEGRGAGARPADHPAEVGAQRRARAGVARRACRCRDRRRVRQDPAERRAGGAAARLHQRPRLAAAEVSRRRARAVGRDRRRGRDRCRDHAARRGHGHGAGWGRAPRGERARGYFRRAARPARAERCGRADRDAAGDREWNRAAGRAGSRARDPREDARQDRWRDRLGAARARDRRPDPRRRSMARCVRDAARSADQAVPRRRHRARGRGRRRRRRRDRSRGCPRRVHRRGRRDPRGPGRREEADGGPGVRVRARNRRRRSAHMTSRELARRVLERIERDKAWATPTLDGELARANLDDRDRRLASELVYGVLRHRARLDRLIGAHAALKQTPLRVVIALRVAAYQLRFLDRVPAYAVVDDAVGAARASGGAKLAGFANAVLRKVGSAPEPTFRGLGDEFSLPAWILNELRAADPDQVAAHAAALATSAPLVARANRRRTTRDAVIELLHEAGVTAHPVDVEPGTPQAFSIDNLGDPARSPSFTAGQWTVQDPGAQLVAHFAAPRAGMAILDACAGVGGKSTHLAELSDDAAKIDAADRSETKLV